MITCALDIKNDIIDDVRDKLNKRGLTPTSKQTMEVTDMRQALQSIKEINDEFGEKIVTFSYTSDRVVYIDPSNKLVDRYYERYIDSLGVRQLNDAEKERGEYTEEHRGEFFSIDARTTLENVAIIDSISNKLGLFNTYFRRSDTDDLLKERLLQMGLTDFEVRYLEALDRKSPKSNLNFSVLLANEYSNHLQTNVLTARLAKLKMMEANKELDKMVLDFLKPFGVTMQEIDNIKEKFGVDAFGVADIMNKVIYASKNRNYDTIPEEVGHFYTELIGTRDSDLGKQLMMKIENWSGYAKVLADYSNVYKTSKGEPDIDKIKKEAIGQAIAEAIIKKYSIEDKNIPAEERSFWEMILKLIEKIRGAFLKSPNFKPLEVLTDEIAQKIFNKDYSDILDRIQKVKEKNTELKTYEGTLKNLPNVRKVIDKIISMGGVLGGSLALRAQGELYRDINEKIHDLDFSIEYKDWKGNWEDFIARFKQEFPNYYTLSEKPFGGNSGELVFNGIITDYPELYEKFKNLTGDFNTRLESFSLEEQDRILLIDFFLHPEGYKVKQVKGLTSAAVTFNAKSHMGMRPKDVFDLLNYTPYEKNDDLSEYSYYSLKTPVYSGVFLNTDDLVSRYGQTHENLYAHHSTIEFKPESVEELPTGQAMGLHITGRLTTDKVDVLLVENPLSKNRHPHITLSTARGVKPSESNTEIAKNEDKIVPLDDEVTGVIGWSDGKIDYTKKTESTQDQQQLQLDGFQMSKASPETIEKIKRACDKMGIKLQDLLAYAKAAKLDITSINGVADMVRGVIAVAEGREDVALTEEMVHLATAILEQTNPKMVTEMIAKIDRFEIYKRTLEAYKGNKNYQLSNGKPDIRKIKKEAVDKLIAELIINRNEGTTEFPELRDETNRSMIRNWWNAITDHIRGMYKKSNIAIFEDAANMIEGGEIGGTVKDLKRQDVFYQMTDAQRKTVEKLQDVQKRIYKRVETKKEADPLLLDSEEANNYYEFKKADGTFERVAKRVTDRVKAWYQKRFGNKDFTKEEKAFNELKRKYGVRYHSFFEEIHDRYFNKDGTRKAKADPRIAKIDTVDQEVYDKIEKYYTELINLLPEGTIVLSEVVVYDEKEKEAGTIDFLAIDKNGKAHILDWKFMYISPDPRNDDVAWFKQGAYDIQLGRYKQMLKDNYGIKEFGMIRAIPFLMKFEKENPRDAKSDWVIRGISAGSADKSKITSLKLMPVAEKSESTGYEELDKLIRKLNALLGQIGKQQVVDETEREFKIERMNTIRRAVRIVQGSMNIAPLIDVIEVMRKDGERLLEDYNVTYKDKISTREDFNDKDLSDFADEMSNYIKFSEMFTQISALIGDLIYTDEMLKNETTEEGRKTVLELKEVLGKLQDEQTQITKIRMKLQDASMNFADKHVGQRNLVGGLLNPEAIVKGLSSLFRGVSELPTAALRLLYKITTAAKGKAMSESLKEVQELMEIRQTLAKRGGDLRKLVRKIYQSDEKGNLVNKLIYKYKKEFYDTMKEKKEAGGSKKWLLENVDIEAYKEEALAKMNENIEKLKKRRFRGTPEQEAETREELILNEKRRWDIDRKDFNGWDNYILKRHPKDTWFSDEYKAIRGDADLLKLFNFISKFNEKSKEVGYINGIVSATFLPFVRKSMAEELLWDHSISPVKNFANSLQMRADDVGYGKFNELTGELENSIPKYYTHDFTKAENGVNDYSEVSEDLFKNLILYIQQVNKYKYLSEVEGQIKLLKTVEEFKGFVQTSRSGNVVKNEAGENEHIPNRNDNAKLFDDFMRTLLYEQKYVLSDADTPLHVDKVLNGVKKIINKVAGREIWKEGQADKATSLVKSMDAMNKGFQLKVLGLDPISGSVNAFGGNIQMATQAGNYFKAREFLKNEFKLSGMRFKSKEEQDIFRQSVELFMPMKDDPSYEMMKKAGMSIGTRGSASDFLFAFMRLPEQLLEKSVFETLLENMMVENGRIVSIREFVKSKYKGRSKSSQEYRTAKDNIEKEIEELKKTRAIAVTRKLENGKLVIPGLDLNNREELQRLTNLTRRISRNATGGISDGDINRMSMSIWTKSMMVFRGWIPKLADTRFSEFRKVSDDFSVRVNDQGEIEGEKYDVGRIRLLGLVLMDSLSNTSTSITNIMVMNDKGVEAIDRLYEKFSKSYKERTGEDLNMDRDEFTDLIRTNLRNQIKELLVLATLVSMGFTLGFYEPDDDEDKAAKNRFRYTQKVVDKFISELSFFYNPINFEQVLSGSTFPALGLITDFTKFIGHFFEEITGFDMMNPSDSAEEVREKAKPLKYVLKNLPTGRPFMSFMSIFSDDFARDFDITIQRESNMK